MKEQLIDFETAKLAEEKGLLSHELDVDTYYYSDKTEGKLGHLQDLADICRIDKDYVLAPTQSLLQKWLREKHNISITVQMYRIDGVFKYECWLVYGMSGYYNDFMHSNFKTFEQALEKGLIESLKLIK